MNRWLVFTGIGFELIGLIVLGVWIGKELENIKPFGGLWVAICILTAFVLWFIHLLVLLKRVNTD
ncbi:MAG: hypothetical protein WCH11_00320 [Bdellovibrio sp.]